MKIKEIEYWVEERKNTYTKSGYEFALYVSANGVTYTVWTWDEEPSKQAVDLVVRKLQHMAEFALEACVDRSIIRTEMKERK